MTERNEPADRRHEEALSAALHEQARTVRPAGDGLVRIRSRVQRRRRRVRFLAPLASVAAAAAAVTAIVASGLVTSSPSRHSVAADVSTTTPAATTPTRPAVVATAPPSSTASSPSVAPASSVGPAVTTSATLTTGPSTSPASTGLAANNGSQVDPPVWPFGDVAAAATWQHALSQKPSEAWHLDSRQVAQRFVHALEVGLGLPVSDLSGPAPVIHDDGTATVDVTRTGPNGSTLTLGTVTLSRWTGGADGPWGVMSVTSPVKSQFPLSIKAPLPGTAVTAPLPVSIGMVGGAEDDVYTTAWKAGAALPAAHNHDVLGSDKTETLTSGIPSSGTGFVAVLDGSSATGSFGLSRLAVTPVRYGPGGTAATTYVVVHDGQLQVWDAISGTKVRSLGTPQTVATQVQVSEDRQWVYYLNQKQGLSSPACGRNVLMRTRLDGSGAPEPVTGAPQGITAFGIAGSNAEQLATVATPCSNAGAQSISWSGTTSGTIMTDSRPPEAENVAIAPDGTELASFVRTGMQGALEKFSTSVAKTYADGSPLSTTCSASGVECPAAAFGSGGLTYVVVSDGSRLTVYSTCDCMASWQLFSVADSSQRATLDVDATGQVLLTDGTGKGWIFDGKGPVRPIPTSVIDASW